MDPTKGNQVNGKIGDEQYYRRFTHQRLLAAPPTFPPNPYSVQLRPQAINPHHPQPMPMQPPMQPQQFLPPLPPQNFNALLTVPVTVPDIPDTLVQNARPLAYRQDHAAQNRLTYQQHQPHPYMQQQQNMQQQLMHQQHMQQQHMLQQHMQQQHMMQQHMMQQQMQQHHMQQAHMHQPYIQQPYMQQQYMQQHNLKQQHVQHQQMQHRQMQHQEHQQTQNMHQMGQMMTPSNLAQQPALSQQAPAASTAYGYQDTQQAIHSPTPNESPSFQEVEKENDPSDDFIPLGQPDKDKTNKTIDDYCNTRRIFNESGFDGDIDDIMIANLEKVEEKMNADGEEELEERAEKNMPEDRLGNDAEENTIEKDMMEFERVQKMYEEKQKKIDDDKKEVEEEREEIEEEQEQVEEEQKRIEENISIEISGQEEETKNNRDELMKTTATLIQMKASEKRSRTELNRTHQKIKDHEKWLKKLAKKANGESKKKEKKNKFEEDKLIKLEDALTQLKELEKQQKTALNQIREEIKECKKLLQKLTKREEREEKRLVKPIGQEQNNATKNKNAYCNMSKQLVKDNINAFLAKRRCVQVKQQGEQSTSGETQSDVTVENDSDTPSTSAPAPPTHSRITRKRRNDRKDM